MSSPAARAEARRKAILNRGGDRLAKLTTSARGEDPAYVREDTPPRGSAAFLGETSNMPPPPPPPKDKPRSVSSPSYFTTQPSSHVWSPDEQRQHMLPPGPIQPTDFSPPPGNDPFANIMAQLATMSPPQAGAPGKAPVAPSAPKPPTHLQKWLPLLHVVCMWALLAFFVLWQEPHVFVQKTAGAVEVPLWRRWQTLVNQGASEGAWSIQAVPFFWAFMTLQVMLHSLRIFTGHNDVRPPALLSLALPHLPAPLPSLIMNGLRYLNMSSIFLDDAAAVVFGIGSIVLVTSWLVD